MRRCLVWSRALALLNFNYFSVNPTWDLKFNLVKIFFFSRLYVPTCAGGYTVLLATMTPGLPRWPSHKSTLVATLVETAAREVRPTPIVAMNTHLQQPRKKIKCSRLTDAFHRPRIALKEQQSFPNQENSQHYVHCHHHTVMLTIWRFFYRNKETDSAISMVLLTQQSSSCHAIHLLPNLYLRIKLKMVTWLVGWNWENV